MDHMGKEMALVQQADKPSSVNLIYSLRSNLINKCYCNIYIWRSLDLWVHYVTKNMFCNNAIAMRLRK